MLSGVARFIARVMSHLRRRTSETDLADEVGDHIAMLEDDLRHLGLAPDAARREARIQVGGVAQLREAHRDTQRFSWCDALARDVSFAFRGMRRHPVFTAVALLTLAIGIGANAAMFSNIHAVLLRPLPYPDPESLVSVRRGELGAPQGRFVSMERLEIIQRGSRSLGALGAFFAGTEDVALSGSETPEALKAARVSANFFSILGVSPVAGRSFLPEDDVVGGAPVALMGERLWKRRFGSAVVLSQALRLSVIGVLAGLTAAYLLSRVLQSLLFEVRATEVAVYAEVAGLFVTVALLAALVPAWRAIRVSPLIALKGA
jgi:hypothetical protein